ncbi:hypothetical protein DY000_02055565 [Brassica cretica]|uniref:Uncharacterized protein n=1 Tax=Brassica cretica TaxID=69181 RepID=A0ABQ7ACK3_BRACR|nr:hypothetical protein DY000_02055565 [Brassica cretica]
MNGSLDSNFLIDIIGQPIDIGDIQAVPVQCKETKKLEFTLTGQIQITNTFDSSTIEINPPGFDVQDYLQVLPKNELVLTTGSHELTKHKGSKHQPDKWSIYPERSILDIIMATDHYKKTPGFRRQIFRGHTDENGRRKFLVGK